MARTYATSGAVLAVAILFPVLGLLSVVLRFFAVAKTKGGRGLDDWLVLPALALTWAMGALLIWGASTKSLGDLLPPPTVPGPDGYLFTTTPQQIRLQQIQYHVDWIGVLAFGLMKLSILFFYRKIFCPRGTRDNLFNILTKAMIGVVVAWTIAFGFGTIFVCKADADNAWAPIAVVAQSCSAQLPLLEGYAISDFIIDVLIWSMPIPKIWTLHMPTRRKVAVATVFLVGLLTIAASAARMAIYIIYVVNAFAQSDGETLVTYLMFWTMIECGLALLVVCLPAMRSLVGKTASSGLLSAIKSAFSLQSLRSQGGTYKDSMPLGSMDKASKASLAGKGSTLSLVDGSTSEHAVRAPDLEAYPVPGSGIRVTTNIDQY